VQLFLTKPMHIWASLLLYLHFKNLKMKTILLLIISIFSITAFAQNTIAEGTLTYNISIETTKGEKQLASALNGAVLTLFLTKEKSRTEMKSTLGTETTVYDSKANKGFILKEYSGQKLMITTTNENWTQKNLISNNLNFTIDNATTTIAGYLCKKATATSADGKNYTVYFDETKRITNKSYNNAFPQLPGLPVQYELQSGNLVFKYTLSKTNADAIVATKFDAPKAEFRVMTYEENQQLKKGE
jgi:GLPGLI family protein